MSRPLSSAARTAMIDSARELIATEGVRACTVDEIARRTGIAKTTIYRHFGGSDALVLAAVDGIVKGLEPPDTGSLLGDLTIIQKRYLRIAHDPRMRELYTWMSSRSLQDPEFATLFRRVRVQPQGVTVVALQRAIGRGEVEPTIDIPLAMHLIQGPFMSKRIMENEEVSDAEFAALMGYIVRGLTGR